MRLLYESAPGCQVRRGKWTQGRIPSPARGTAPEQEWGMAGLLKTPLWSQIEA